MYDQGNRKRLFPWQHEGESRRQEPEAQCVVILNALQEEIRATLFVVPRCHGGEARKHHFDDEVNHEKWNSLVAAQVEDRSDAAEERGRSGR